MSIENADEVEFLLPWYVTGKLDAENRQRVELALADDPRLRHQLALIEDEIGMTRLDHEAIRVPSSLSAENLLNTAGIAASGKPGWLNAIRTSLSAAFSGPARYATACGLVLLVAQALALGTLLRDRPGGTYQQASGPSHIIGTSILVRFADGVTMAEVAAALSRENYVITDGPRAGGLYSLRVSDTALSDAERQVILDRLLAMDGIIQLALPSN